MNKFHYSQFFEDTGEFKELFDSTETPWQALSNLELFIDNFEKVYEGKGYTKLRDGVFIGRDVEIDGTALIKDKAIIGHNSKIGHAAFVRGNVLIGENVNIGHGTEFKHSITLSNTAIAHLNFVGDSILGSNINISGGTIIANTRLDKEEVKIKDGEVRIGVGTNKFGCLMGDGSFIGANSVTNPGTVLSKQTRVFPLVSVSGTHLKPSTIK